ncbi:MAG: hypothetical protein K8Q97_02740 [Candidatus Andersenbacteria bacterium]|nr:hypothetical protein [Candidatus Andersenbacteria bacterium]
MKGSIKRKITRIPNMFTKSSGLSTDLSTIIPQRRSIIVIIVHFGNKKDTNSLVDSLKNNARVPDDIIVIDNDVDNRGYLGGLKAGVFQSRQSGYRSNDLLVLLNNDLRVGVGFISEIERWWDEQGSPRTLAGPTAGQLSVVTGRAHVRSLQKRVLPKGYVHGSCLIVERAFFEQLSDMEDFFMYWEDVAMSLRALALGGNLKIIPNLPVYHDDVLASMSGDKLYYLVRNGAYVLEKLKFPWGAYWRIGNSLRYAYHRLLGHDVIVRALRDRKSIL